MRLNFHVDFRQTSLDLKRMLVEGRGYRNYNNEEVTKEDKKELKEAEPEKYTEEKEEEDDPVLRVTHIKKNPLSISAIVEVYIKTQQIYSSKRLYVNEFYITKNS